MSCILIQFQRMCHTIINHFYSINDFIDNFQISETYERYLNSNHFKMLCMLFMLLWPGLFWFIHISYISVTFCQNYFFVCVILLNQQWSDSFHMCLWQVLLQCQSTMTFISSSANRKPWMYLKFTGNKQCLAPTKSSWWENNHRFYNTG